MKKIRVYETIVVDKELNGCEDCPASSIHVSPKHMGGLCILHQRYLDDCDVTTHHIPIPDWCKIDEVKYPLRF